MAVTGVNNYSNIYTNAYTGNIRKNNAKETTEKQVVEQTEDVKTGTNSSTGEYYNGLSSSYKTTTGLLANDININYTLNNYGFLEAEDFLKKLVKTVKEELHESKKKEV